MTEGSQHRVFVYGTLMTGLRNHHFMDGAKCLGQSKTMLASYDMVQFPSISSPGNITPGVIKNGSQCIAGELYMVSDHGLEMLDQLEQVGFEYERSKVMLDDGSQAWAYFLIAQKERCIEGTPNFVQKNDDQVLSWDGHAEESSSNKMRAAA